MKIKEFEKITGFKPSFTYWGLDYLLHSGDYFSKRIENTELLELVKKLVELAYPDEEDKKVVDRRWFNFYMPVRMGKAVAYRTSVVNYKEMYALIIGGFKPLDVFPGSQEVEEDYFDLVKELIKFSKALKKHPSIIKKCLPYDIRTGKVLGKYVMKKVLLEKEKKEILERYDKHVNAVKPSYPISLKKYLGATSVCYKAAFGEKTKNMSPVRRYKKWADGRDCGMLEIKNPESKKEFAYWLKHKSYCGGHPFEIVFSWSSHGIHLYPPNEKNPYFKLYVTNYAYAWHYLKMAEAMIKQRISFKAPEIEKVLKFLAGETYFKVNERAEHFIRYSKEYKNIKKHIQWDEIKLPKWKQ